MKRVLVLSIVCLLAYLGTGLYFDVFSLQTLPPDGLEFKIKGKPGQGPGAEHP